MGNRQLKRQIIRDDHKRQKEFLSNKSENEKRMILLLNAEIEVISTIQRRVDKEKIFDEAEGYLNEIEENDEVKYPPEYHNLLMLMGMPVIEYEEEEKATK